MKHIPTRGYRLELLAGGDREWLTENQRLFWRVRSNRVKAWRTYTAARAKQAGIPPMDRAYVLAELRFADRRRRDPSNWMPTAKACVDGLVDAGLFPDDNHRFLTGPDLRMGIVVTPALRGIHLFIYPHGEVGT